MTQLRSLAVIAFTAAFAGCAHIGSIPINEPITGSGALTRFDSKIDAGERNEPVADDGYMIGLAFSGGGTRAAAFSFGALRALDRTEVAAHGQKINLLDSVDFVSGVSGGSVTAAYFGLKKRAALGDFRERFLIKNAEENLNTSKTLANLGLGLGGGVNDDTRLRDWLDNNLFDKATFSSLPVTRRPIVWINATDVYNRTPFLFVPLQFNLICSNLATYPISAAVAASAAVPIVFSPVAIAPYPESCNPRLPDWLLKAEQNSNLSPQLRSFVRGLKRQSDGSMKYIKLFDGGLVDNYGLSGFTITRELSQTPYGPLTPEEAVRLRRLLFIVVDAGAETQKDWAQTLEGPSGGKLIEAITDVTLDAAKLSSYSAFESSMRNWRDALIRWRCRLPKAEVSKLIHTKTWDCRDLQFFVGRIGFDQLGRERAEQLDRIPTRFNLPAQNVDDLIAAGADALANNSTYHKFVSSLR